MDYNFHGSVLYSRVARDAVSVAAAATAILDSLGTERRDVAIQSAYLMKEVSLLSLLV